MALLSELTESSSPYEADLCFFLQKKRLGEDFWNVIQNLHSKRVLAFYLAHGDMFRA